MFCSRYTEQQAQSGRSAKQTAAWFSCYFIAMPVAVHIITAVLDNKQKEFIEYVLSRYIETGVEELDQEKLPILLTNKYQSLEDAKEILGDVASISRLFIEFQQHLYKQNAA